MELYGVRKTTLDMLSESSGKLISRNRESSVSIKVNSYIRLL